MVGRDLGYPAAREPHNDDAPLEAYAFPREVEHIPPHRIEDDVRPAPVGCLFDDVDEVFLFVVHRDVGPELPADFDLLCTPGRRDHARTGRHRKLYGRRTHAPSAHRQVDAIADLHDGTRNLCPGSKGKRRPLLVLAPAQEDVEEVQGRRLDFDDDLTGAWLWLFYLLQQEGTFRVSELVHLPGAHHGPPFHSRYGNPSLPCPFCRLPGYLTATHDNRLAGGHVVGGRGEEATSPFRAFGHLKRCVGMSSSILYSDFSMRPSLVFVGTASIHFH